MVLSFPAAWLSIIDARRHALEAQWYPPTVPQDGREEGTSKRACSAQVCVRIAAVTASKRDRTAARRMQHAPDATGSNGFFGKAGVPKMRFLLLALTLCFLNSAFVVAVAIVLAYPFKCS